MRKVKNFKIHLRTKDIIRSIKRLSPDVQAIEDFDFRVQKACRYYSNFVKPCVIYDAFTKGLHNFVYEKDAPSRWIARSIFFVSIGEILEEEYKKNPDLYGQYSEKIVSTLAVDALDQSKNFISRLIAIEAQSENCDISRSVEIPSQFYEEISQMVPMDKINISLQEGSLLPKYSMCAMVYWTPSKKKSKK
jgi:hypothetical protein